MTKGEAVKWIANLMADIGEPQYSALWHYEQALSEIRGLIETEPEIIRCKDCRHRIVNDHYGERGYLKIKGYCELDTGDPFELGRDAENDDWFCADAERREERNETD